MLKRGCRTQTYTTLTKVKIILYSVTTSFLEVWRSMLCVASKNESILYPKENYLKISAL